MSMKRYQIRKDLIVQKLDNKTVVFDSDKSLLFTLNETASYIFRKLKGGADEKKLVFLFAKRYSVSVTQAEKDIRTCITDMEKKKILS